MIMKTALIIAGSDSSGGAGIQADIKTMTAHKVFATTAITAMTAQNTTGVTAVQEATPQFIAAQLDAVFTDIFPDAVKIGMVSNVEIIHIISQKLKQYGAKNIVLDPVMVATSGSRLFADNAIQALVELLFPLADLITPNIPEAESLSELSAASITQSLPHNITISDTSDMLAAAERLAPLTKGGVLIKGGHLASSADDLLYLEGQPIWLRGERIDNLNTHGTGCTLSSAIACNLALGLPLEASVRAGKAYVTDALRAGLDLGKGSGPLNHCCRM